MYQPDPSNHTAGSLVLEIKRNNPCSDCHAYFHPIQLDFDHISGTKRNGVGRMAKDGYSTSTILEEIRKCELVCASCHRLRTLLRGTWDKQRGRKPL